MPSTVYLELFDEVAIIGNALPTLVARIPPLTGPEFVPPYTSEHMSLSGDGFAYNNSMAAENLADNFVVFQVTVPPMSAGSVSVLGVSQRDIDGFIPSSTPAVVNDGLLLVVGVTASNNNKFCQFQYNNVKAENLPFTELSIGRQLIGYVTFPAFSTAIYPVTPDPVDIRFEFSQTRFEIFINGVSAGAQNQDCSGALFDTFQFSLPGGAGLSSIQIIEGLATGAGRTTPLPELTPPFGTPIFRETNHAIDIISQYADIQYQTGHSRRRRVYTASPRNVAVEWFLTEDQMLAVDSWYENDLLAGERTFSCQLKSPDGRMLWWEAQWIEPYKATPTNSGYWTVTGNLLVIGPSSVAPPENRTLAIEVRAALTGRARLTVGLPLAMEILVELSEVVGIAMEMSVPVDASAVSDAPAMLRETSGFILREDGGRILRE